jgi:hypothetical protein
MALAIIVGKVMFVVVMVETAYGRDAPADYPDLAGKVNYPVLNTQFPVNGIPGEAPSTGDLRPAPETTRFAVSS